VPALIIGKRATRNTWHFFEGRPGRHGPLPNTGSVWPSNVQKAFILSALDSPRSAEGNPCSLALRSPRSIKRNIYKYLATKNSFVPQMPSTPSQAPADRRFSGHSLFPRHPKTSCCLPILASRGEMHRPGNSRENHLYLVSIPRVCLTRDKSREAVSVRGDCSRRFGRYSEYILHVTPSCREVDVNSLCETRLRRDCGVFEA